MRIALHQKTHLSRKGAKGAKAPGIYSYNPTPYTFYLNCKLTLTPTSLKNHSSCDTTNKVPL